MSLAGEAATTALKFSLSHVALVGSIAAAIGIYAGYLFWHHAVFQEGYDTCKAEVAQATAEAKAEHESQQALISKLSESSQPKLKAQFDEVKKGMDRLRELAEHPPSVTTKDCKLTPEAKTAYNNAIH